MRLLLTTKHTNHTKETEEMADILYKEECYGIQGAVFEVYKEMGCGFLEAVYQECVEREFRNRDIPFARKVELCLHYKGEPLEYLVCFVVRSFQTQAVTDPRLGEDIGRMRRIRLDLLS